MTLEQQARRMLRRAMIKSREMTPAAMQRYIEAHIPTGSSADADQLPIRNVGDAVAFLTLSRMAIVLSHEPNPSKRRAMQSSLGFMITPKTGGRVDNDFFNAPQFTLTRKQ